MFVQVSQCHFLLENTWNKKDVGPPYDQFDGGMRPWTLLCVRKRRIPFLEKRSLLGNFWQFLSTCPNVIFFCPSVSILSKCPQAVFYLLPYCQAVFYSGMRMVRDPAAAHSQPRVAWTNFCMYFSNLKLYVVVSSMQTHQKQKSYA